VYEHVAFLEVVTDEVEALAKMAVDVFEGAIAYFDV
jgi:hypothetical protein